MRRSPRTPGPIHVAVIVLLVYVLIGALNTLAMAALARRAELAILRLVGATGDQVLRMARIEQAMLLELALIAGGVIAALTFDLVEVNMSGDIPERLGEGNWRCRERGTVDRQLDHRRRIGSGRRVLRRESRDKRVWLIRLQEAASGLATSYLQDAATANDRRRAGADRSQVETATYVVDRQKALGRFRTLPWSSDFEAHRQAMGRGIDGVWRAWYESDDEF